MSDKTRRIILAVVSLTIACIMLMPLVGYFVAGVAGASFTIILRYVLSGIAVHAFGIVLLANLGSQSAVAASASRGFVGLYAALALILGSFRLGLETEAQIWLMFAVLGASFMLGACTTVTNARIRFVSTLVLVIIFISVFAYGVTAQPGILAFHTYQLALGIGAILSILLMFDMSLNRLAKLFHLSPTMPIAQATLLLLPLLLGFGVYGFGVFHSLGALANGVTASIVSPSLVLGQLVVMVGIALLGVGWLTRRSFNQSLARLGVGGLNVRAAAWTLVGVIGLVALNYGLELVGSYFGWIDLAAQASQSQAAFSQFSSLPLLLLLAASAGIGEEILFRGALQPRFGLVATTLAFALVHVQYNWFGMVVVLALGAVLGLIRKRLNTTAAIGAHLLYDLLGLILLGLG